MSPKRGSLRLGVVILADRDWSVVREEFRAVEALGFDHAWTYDHMSLGRSPAAPMQAAMTVLAAAAVSTERIGLGTLVATPNLHHPVALAYEFVTLDRLAPGRIVCGIGSGGLGQDSQATSLELSLGARLRRFEEFAEIVSALIRDGEVSHDGGHYSIGRARMNVRPGSGGLAVGVAATGPRAAAVAARHADLWITSGPDGGPYDIASAAPRLREQWEWVREACERAGRDPGGLRRLLMTGSRIRGDLDSLSAFEEVLEVAGELGFTDLAVHWPRPDLDLPGQAGILEQIAAYRS